MMSVEGLQIAICYQITQELGVPSDANMQSNFAKALATAIIDYLKAHAVVNTSGQLGHGAGNTVTSVGTLT